MRGRMYDPALKRFITPDPFVTETWNPQGLNRFSYVQNSPLNFWDPSGFQQEPPDQSAAGAPDRSGGAHQSGYESYANGGTGNWFTDGGGLGGAGNQGAGAAQPGGVAGYPDPSGGDQCRAGGTVREANGAAGSPQGPDPGSMAPVAQGTPQNGGATQPASGPGSDAGGHAERSGDGKGQGGAGSAGRAENPTDHSGVNGNDAALPFSPEFSDGEKTFWLFVFRMIAPPLAVGAVLIRGPGKGGARPPNLSPPGAGRRGAFRAAKRASGVPTSQQPRNTGANVDKRGNPQPGREYKFKGENGEDVIIRDDAAGHYYGPGNPQNRGPHFNDARGNHYDY